MAGVVEVPVVDIGLGGGGEEFFPCAEPGEEPGRAGELSGGAVAGIGLQGAGAGGLVEFGELVPGDVLAQQPLMAGVGDRRELAELPLLEEQDLPVHGGEGAAGHEQVAQVGGGAPAGQLVEGGVGEGDLPLGQALQVAGQVMVVAQPVHAAVGWRHGVQGFQERDEFGAGMAGAVVEQVGELVVQDAPGADPPGP